MPGYTKLPNDIIDQTMPNLSGNGWKLLALIWRNTAGWGKTSDRLSYAQIMSGTGMRGRQTVNLAIQEVSRVIAVEPATGRGNWCRFDITNLLNSSFSEPITLINSSENEPIRLPKSVNSSVSYANSSGNEPINPVKSSVSEPTKERKDLKEINPKEKKKKDSPGPVTQAFLSICRQDYEFVSETPRLRKAMLATLKLLDKRGATPELIREFDVWRVAHHWTRAGPPTLAQVGEFWWQFEEWIEAGRPAPAENGKEKQDDNNLDQWQQSGSADVSPIVERLSKPGEYRY